MEQNENTFRAWRSSQESALDRARRFRWRIRVLQWIFTGCFFLLLMRSVNLMVMPPDILESRVLHQHRQEVELSPRRGMIFDRHGKEMAVSVNAVSIYADPREVQKGGDPRKGFPVRSPEENVAEAVKLLDPLLEVDAATLHDRLSRSGRFAWLERRMSDQQAALVDALDIPGVHLLTEPRRAYPNKELAASLLGFTDPDGKGLEGLERTFNENLNGTSSSYVRMRDARGRDVSSDGVLLRQSRDGGHMVLTLDLGIQYAAEEALRHALMRTSADGGFVLALDPHTGEILALAQQPGFNPNAYGKYDMSAYRLRVGTDTFEPGSTIKPFVIAAALQEGLTRPEETFDCEMGKYQIGKNIVNDTHEYGVISVADIIQVSSNIGTTKVAERLGKEKLYEWLRAFGFGQNSGSGLLGEVRGILRPPKRWARITLATHAFGQGLTVTGVQLAAAYGALANGGRLITPWLIREKLDAAGHIKERGESVEVRRVLRDDIALTMDQMMRRVTEPEGTAPLAAVPGYQVAGKTGTAQKVAEGTGHYGKGMYVSSFAGFIPAQDPRIVIIAVIDEPKGNPYYGGLVAAPVFREVAMAAMRQMGIPPTEPIQPLTVIEKALAHAAKIDIEDMKPLTFDGPGLSPAGVDLSFHPVTPARDGEVTGESFILPDFSGQTLRRVLDVISDKNFALEVSGHGRAITQIPEAGSVVKSGDPLKLVFSPDPVAVLTAGAGR